MLIDQMMTASALSMPRSLPSIDELPLEAEYKALFQKNVPISAVSCKKTHLNESMYLKGPWTPEEDEILRWAVMCSRPVMWDDVSKRVRGRSPKQCRERWSYRISPELKKTPFEKWEDDTIIEKRRQIGNKWTLIASSLPGRTSCSVKNRWYTVLRNRMHGDDIASSPN